VSKQSWNSVYYWNTELDCFSEMNTRKVGLLYCTVFKGFKVHANKAVQWKIAIYITHHSELKLQKSEPWYCSEVSPGFNHEAVDYYLIVSPKPLKEPICSHDTIRYSSLALHNFLKKGTLFMEIADDLPQKIKACVKRQPITILIVKVSY